MILALWIVSPLDDKFRVEVQFQFDIVVNLAQNLCRLRDGGGDAGEGRQW